MRPKREKKSEENFFLVEMSDNGRVGRDHNCSVVFFCVAGWAFFFFSKPSVNVRDEMSSRDGGAGDRDGGSERFSGWKVQTEEGKWDASF